MRFFRRKKKKTDEAPPSEHGPSAEELIDQERSKAEAALDAFFVTRSGSGVLHQTDHLTVRKTGEKLLRVEGERVTLLVSFGTFYGVSGGKLVGLAQVDEVDFCRILENKKELHLKDILTLQSRTPLSVESEEVFHKAVKQKARHSLEEEIYGWPDRQTHFLLSKVRIHLLAHGCIALGQDFTRWVVHRISNNYKQMLLDELRLINISHEKKHGFTFEGNFPLIYNERALRRLDDEVQKLRNYKSRETAERPVSPPSAGWRKR